MKRIGSLIFIVVFILQLAIPTNAVFAPTPELYHFESQGVGEYGYEDFILVDENGNEVIKDETSSTKDDLLYSVNLPSSYDSRDYGYITSPKNQGSTGNCWAFGTISALESDSIVKGIDDLETADYSEAHLVWFAKNSATTDTTHPTYGEGSTNSDPYTGSSAGGNWQYSTNALARWSGLAEDSDYPFYPYNATQMGNYPESQRYDTGSGIVINSTEMMLDNNDMKQWIMEHGSVTAAYYHNDAYLNTSTYAYNCNATFTSNHMITIVGWDDNYSVDNFIANYRPASNGAWLVKNSWGENWGLDGYFWLSYEDPSIKQKVGFSSRSAGNAKNNYTYTAEGWVYTVSLSKMQYANVFTAKNHENLTEVATYVCNPNTDLTFSIYTDIRSDYDSPSQGTLAATWSTHVDREGYHTFEVPEEVLLEPNMIYSVAIQTSCTDVEKNQAPMEHIDYPANEGESFLYINGGWTDLTTYNYGNFCIQALTSEHDHEYSTISKNNEHPHTTTKTCSICNESVSENVYNKLCHYCNFTFTETTSDEYTITDYIGQGGDVSIPAEIDGKEVKTIGANSFRDTNTVNTVSITNGVTTIGNTAFMNCSSLEGIYIPSSVTDIGTQAFYGCDESLIIYCHSGSAAHQYAIDNNIKFFIIDLKDTEDTTIDLANSLIITELKNCTDSTDIVSFADSTQVIVNASYTNANAEYCGTGTILTLFENGVHVGDYTVVVVGDLNGDSVCDVLDASKTERISNSHTTATLLETYAVNGEVSDTIDVNSYQYVVNMALAG